MIFQYLLKTYIVLKKHHRPTLKLRLDHAKNNIFAYIFNDLTPIMMICCHILNVIKIQLNSPPIYICIEKVWALYPNTQRWSCNMNIYVTNLILFVQLFSRGNFFFLKILNWYKSFSINIFRKIKCLLWN